ncbi:MAG: mechanosensitive ion channel [Alphaproteobacteria bacterium]|nr:MAG: mechanosensitive ion channel [Alphaproteobacteria bacterium]
MENMSIDFAKLYELVLVYGVQLLTGVAIFFIGRWASKIATRFARAGMEKAKLDKTLVSFVGNLLYYALLGFTIIAAMGQMGIETTSFAAAIAAAGLAVGLALQGSLSNFASGVMIVLFRPFKVGDFIEAAGATGTVDGLNILSTTLKTPDNKIVIVPNKNIMGGNITNFSARDTRRIDLVFSIGYDDDIKAAKKIIEKTVKADKRVLDDPAPMIAVMELAANSVDFAVRPWVKSSDLWATRCDLIEAIKLEFDKAGISIPFPQRDVHIYEAAKKPAAKSTAKPSAKAKTKKAA